MAEALLQMTSPDFRIGKVLSTSFSVFARNALVFSLVAGIVWLPTELTVYWSDQQVDSDMHLIGIVAVFLTITLVYPIGIAILLHATFQTMRGQPVSLMVSSRHGFARIPQLLGVSILTTLGAVGGMFLLIIPGFILLTVWYAAPPVCVVERLGPIASLNRSAALTKGYRWQVFATFTIALFGLGLIEGVLEAGTVAYLGGEAALAVSIVWGGIAQAFTAVLDVVMYHDLRAAKEGLDIERIATVFD